MPSKGRWLNFIWKVAVLLAPSKEPLWASERLIRGFSRHLIPPRLLGMLLSQPSPLLHLAGRFGSQRFFILDATLIVHILHSCVLTIRDRHQLVSSEPPLQPSAFLWAWQVSNLHHFKRGGGRWQQNQQNKARIQRWVKLTLSSESHL